MKTKYADLIKQLERVTTAYDAALAAVRKLEHVTDAQTDVLGVSGGVEYFGDYFEKKRAIQLDADTFTPLAIDCGSDFSYESSDEFTRVDCTLFGYRILCLAVKGSEEEALLLEKANE